MNTKYIPGDSAAFKAFIDEHYQKGTVELRGIDGHQRWVVRENDETEYIVRPSEAEGL